MQQNQWEILILKPTRAFLSFLATQAPGITLPSLKSLQKDCTAYVINRQKDDEATLDEIEKHFTTIFKYEITRCLGKKVVPEIEASFLDFLCCFKFDLHTHILLEENIASENQCLLRVKPRSVVLSWVKEVLEDSCDSVATMSRISLSDLTDNATVIIKNCKHADEVNSFVERQYQAIFRAEMLRIHEDKEEWPNIYSYEDFKNYFSMHIHSQLVYL